MASTQNQTLVQINETESIQNNENKTKIPLKNNGEQKTTTTNTNTQIPFIDDEFEDLHYVLHRRQFNNSTKLPIKEETIVIKSPLTFFQKITTPIRQSFSRRNSQHQISSATTKTTGAPAASKNVPVTMNSAKQENTELCKKEINGNLEFLKVENETTDKENKLVVSGGSNSQLKVTPSSTLTAFTSNSSPKNFHQQIDEANKLNDNGTRNKSTNTIIAGSLAANSCISNRPPPSKRKKPHENRARKALRTITFILGAFIFCFAPWHVVSMYNSFCTNCWDSTFYHHFFYSCYFLCYMNSPINPFMYALANQQFKKTFFRILKGDLRRL
jgi:hypothetical protein